MRKYMFAPRMICPTCKTIHVSYFQKGKPKYTTIKFKCEVCGEKLTLYDTAWFGTKDIFVYKMMLWVVPSLIVVIAFILAMTIKFFIENLWVRLAILILGGYIFYFSFGFLLAKIRRQRLEKRSINV